ncbi:hypothetical protein JFT91_24785 [Pseudomonas sp. TH08]|uniref:amidase family protein n=1 Tax=Pseudomonas sp. TH08 TaxID=2796374 RepID=UPI001912F151|nr:amidase family protein [Pseudomonas sp. TH08]MBK5535752.1 hypothetical protein [Pseudomonas sp. TH08]
MEYATGSSRRLLLAMFATSVLGMCASYAHGNEVDVRELTISEINKDFAQGRYTSEQLTRAFLSRIDQYNPYYNAFTAMNSKALDEARDIDRRRRAGEQLEPMAGIPVVVKDTIDMAGFASTAGYAPLSSKAGGMDLIPERDAAVVQRLRAAGAIILGKTNVPVFLEILPTPMTVGPG